MSHTSLGVTWVCEPVESEEGLKVLYQGGRKKLVMSQEGTCIPRLLGTQLSLGQIEVVKSFCVVVTIILNTI